MPDDLTQDEVNALSGTRKIDRCDCCDFNNVEVTATRVHKFSDGPLEYTIRWYCDLCRATMASNWHRSGRPEGHVLSGMAYMANTILRAIREQGEQQRRHTDQVHQILSKDIEAARLNDAVRRYREDR